MTTQALESTTSPRLSWRSVCTLHDLEVERGRAALVDRAQIALFLLADGTIRATCNRDPYSDAYVLSRGIVGSRGDVPTLSSPMHKQVFDLRTGTCLDTRGKEPARLRTWQARAVDGQVQLLWGRPS
ncbi:nitrite reductase small subunit [Brachybacterium sp. P6-10-X1]|uniref:nitrite reductase small subunit NirD n=1 Tax=Brachybacterium sp. P6-10-X1 TaxID=1903186 RepID=UPI0009719A2E|nr:nitrite reductase small subunit NirD [Brachybacterium sp. P6-10-X1]APX32171.1 nitrite reductase small subunit [Brachybacterium sp. P6-10-X1]